jgi:hypothetical protein
MLGMNATTHPFQTECKKQDKYINVSGNAYTLSDAEQLTNVCKEDIRIMIRYGHIDIVTIPGGWKRIPESELSKIKKQHNKFACR